MSAIADPFDCLLRSISRAQSAIRAATIYHARCGRMRTYLSAADVRAYEQGFNDYPSAMSADAPLRSPYCDGWFDAECRQEEGTSDASNL